MDGTWIWVKFHMPHADLIARCVVAGLQHPSIGVAPVVPHRYRILDYHISKEDTSSIDLLVANGGGPIDTPEIAAHLKANLESGPKAAAPMARIYDACVLEEFRPPPPDIERRVEVDFVRQT